METFEDIEVLWRSPRQLHLPVAADIIKKASKEKNEVARKIFIQVICLSLALLSMAVVLVRVRFQYASSYIGIALMFACVITLAILRFRQSQFLRRADFSQSPAALLHQFELFHKKQKRINTSGTMWYTIVLNIAFAFYFYEMIVLAPFTSVTRLLILAIYLVWMLIAVFWINKRAAKKEHERTKGIICKLKKLQKGFE